MTRRRLPDWVEDYVRRELHAGSSIESLARLFAVSRHCICNARDRSRGIQWAASFAHGEVQRGWRMHNERIRPLSRQPDVVAAAQAEAHRRRRRDASWLGKRRTKAREASKKWRAKSSSKRTRRDWQRRRREARRVEERARIVRLATEHRAAPPSGSERAPRPRRAPGDQVIAPALIRLMRELVRGGCSHREVERRTGIGRGRVPRILARAAASSRA